MGLRESLAGAQCEGFPQLWTVFGDLSLCLCLCQSFTTLSPLIFEVGSFSRGCLSQPWSLHTGWSSTPPHVVARNGSQSSSVAQSCPTLCDPVNRSTPGLPVHHQRPEFTQLMSIESVMPSNHLILCRPLLLLPPIPPSIRVLLNE